MPYKIVRERYHWFVTDAKGKKFSKVGFNTAAEAQRQRIAIALSEAKRGAHPASYYFI
jgi:hypothetical protein